jgi:DNA-binding Lrp family transcriptional regulator
MILDWCGFSESTLAFRKLLLSVSESTAFRSEKTPCHAERFLLDRRNHPETRMTPFFVQIKCHLGKAYEVANRLADAEIASEIYSTAGDFDLLVKFYVQDGTDIGHFVTEKVQTIPGIQDTRTILTFKAFGR